MNIIKSRKWRAINKTDSKHLNKGIIKGIANTCSTE